MNVTDETLCADCLKASKHHLLTSSQFKTRELVDTTTMRFEDTHFRICCDIT